MILDLGAEWLSGRRFNPLFHIASFLGVLAGRQVERLIDERDDWALHTKNGCFLNGAMHSRLLRHLHWVDYAAEVKIAESNHESINLTFDQLIYNLNDLLILLTNSSEEPIQYDTALMDLIKYVVFLFTNQLL